MNDTTTSAPEANPPPYATPAHGTPTTLHDLFRFADKAIERERRPRVAITTPPSEIL